MRPGTAAGQPPPFEADADRLVILSDMHRGKRDRTDDFRPCEDAYLRALAHYDRERYTMALLGDVEELWQNRINAVLSSYADVYSTESGFHEGRSPDSVLGKPRKGMGVALGGTPTFGLKDHAFRSRFPPWRFSAAQRQAG